MPRRTPSSSWEFIWVGCGLGREELSVKFASSAFVIWYSDLIREIFMLYDGIYEVGTERAKVLLKARQNLTAAYGMTID